MKLIYNRLKKGHTKAKKSVTKIMRETAFWTTSCFYPPLNNVEKQWAKLVSSYASIQPFSYPTTLFFYLFYLTFCPQQIVWINYIKIWSLLRPQVTYQPHSKGTFRSSRLEAESCIFIKKETLPQLYSCEFCEIFKNTFFTEHL